MSDVLFAFIMRFYFGWLAGIKFYYIIIVSLMCVLGMCVRALNGYLHSITYRNVCWLLKVFFCVLLAAHFDSLGAKK